MAHSLHLIMRQENDGTVSGVLVDRSSGTPELTFLKSRLSIASLIRFGMLEASKSGGIVGQATTLQDEWADFFEKLGEHYSK